MRFPNLKRLSLDMTISLSRNSGVVDQRFAVASTTRRWAWPQYLALAGIPILVLNAWTVIAWLLDGPAPVTKFRAPSSANWYIAHTIEALCVLGSAGVVVYLVRGCRRSGRILTFDVMFCLVGATLFWADFGLNGFQPVLVASSNFVNLNNTCGHMPFIVNPDCGRAPDPILFFFLMEAFLFLPCVKGVSALAGRLRRGRPTMSTARLFGVVIGIAAVLSLGETILVALDIWSYTGPRAMSIGLGHGGQYNLFVWFQTSAFFGLISALYFFRNDKGQTVVERGLERYTPRRRNSVTLLALYATVQFVAWVPGSVPLATVSFFQDGWAKMPRYLVNDVCDAPGVEGTRYGPCPGSPGYRMPGRHSLPGTSP
jgi:hypothetical protein